MFPTRKVDGAVNDLWNFTGGKIMVDLFCKQVRSF